MGWQLMSGQIDYSRLDRPQVLHFVFYPREDWTSPPPGAVDHSVPVADGISIGCRFYPKAREAANVVYFHGNGEVVYDYDGIAPMYNDIGVNLFVADYRGYGRSSGTPSFASMVADAPIVFRHFRDELRSAGYSGPLFVMGRSLGSLPAVHLASDEAEGLKGLIIESGFASAGRLLTFLLPTFDPNLLKEFEEASLERIRSITLPVLIIHGEYDMIIPYEQALVFHENVGSEDKTLLTIPGAGHNDILFTGMREYFSAIEEFVARHSG